LHLGWDWRLLVLDLMKTPDEAVDFFRQLRLNQVLKRPHTYLVLSKYSSQQALHISYLTAGFATLYTPGLFKTKFDWHHYLVDQVTNGHARLV